jgi:penicillin amidase
MQRLASLILLTSLALSCDSGSSKPNPQPSPYDSIPASTTLTIDGLGGPIDIVRDRYGVPHVHATDMADLAFGFGYVEASDRLAQMNLFRHVASGRVAELFGALQRDQLDNDIEMRMHRMRPLAEAAWAELQASNDPVDQEIVRFADGFSRGVNLFLTQLQAGERTIDPSVLVWFDPERTEPWTPVDSLAIGRLQQWALSYFGDEEIRLTRALQESRDVYDSATDPDLLRRAGGFFDLLMISPWIPRRRSPATRTTRRTAARAPSPPRPVRSTRARGSIATSSTPRSTRCARSRSRAASACAAR